MDRNGRYGPIRIGRYEIQFTKSLASGINGLNMLKDPATMGLRQNRFPFGLGRNGHNGPIRIGRYEIQFAK